MAVAHISMAKMAVAHYILSYDNYNNSKVGTICCLAVNADRTVPQQKTRSTTSRTNGIQCKHSKNGAAVHRKASRYLPPPMVETQKKVTVHTFYPPVADFLSAFQGFRVNGGYGPPYLRIPRFYIEGW